MPLPADRVRTQSKKCGGLMGWYAVRSAPSAERMVCVELERRTELEPFLPLIRIASGKLAPLFSRYLFVKALSHDDLGPVCKTRGVTEIVGPSLRQVPVRSGIVEGLMSVQKERGGFVVDEMVVARSPGKFCPGDLVRVTSGPYCDLVTTLLTVRGNSARLMVLLFGQSRPATVRLDQLELEAS